MNGTHEIALGWEMQPAALALCLGLCAAYAWLVRLRFTARGWAWAAGILTIFLALDSPLNGLAEHYLFSAHMAQHIVLVLVAPALLWTGMPAGTGGRWRAPLPSWAAGIGVMAFWHIPGPFHAAMSHGTVHALEIATLLSAGVLYWRPILAPVREARLEPVPQAAAYLFTSCLACTSIGIVITFAPAPLYPGFSPAVRDAWGISLPFDQQIGGILMWAPCCLVYLTAIMAMFARWYAEDAARPVEALEAPVENA